MHSFTGDEQLARDCLDMGLHISFAGMGTYKRNDELREIARSMDVTGYTRLKKYDLVMRLLQARMQ